MAKYKIHIPTEQFGFVEVELDQEEGRNVAEVYREVSAQFKPSEGLTPKQWNAALDEFLQTNTLKDGANLYQLMSPQQQMCFQEIKKSLKRIVKDEALNGNTEVN